MNIKIIFSFILFLICITSCKKQSDVYFLLPNGELIQQCTIGELMRIKNIRYSQYQGFIMNYSDSLFNDAILNMNNHLNKVGNEVLNETAIKKLQNEKIDNIEFNIPLPKNYSKKDLTDIVSKKYNKYKLINSQNSYNILNDCNEQIAVAEYNNLILPGFKIKLLPINKTCL